MQRVFPWLRLWLLVGAAAMAATKLPPWEKPLEQWSAADVMRILSDSPWAKSATAHVRGYAGNSKRFRQDDFSLSLDFPKELAGTTEPGAADNGEFIGGPVGRAGPVPALQVTIRLESALPVRLALLKAGMTPAEDDGPNRSCIAVIQFPTGWNRYSSVAGDWRDAQAWLAPAGAAPIQASEVRLVERSGNASALVFVFPADGDLITPRLLQFPFLKRNLKTLDFRAEAGLLEIERRFSAAAMTFRGRAEF
jgi:hypothetical protein